jgi:hypothetical protein
MPHCTRPFHSVHMKFVLLDSWQIHVMETDQTTSLTTFIFRDPDLIRKLARVGGALDTPEKQAFLERAIERGAGTFTSCCRTNILDADDRLSGVRCLHRQPPRAMAQSGWPRRER